MHGIPIHIQSDIPGGVETIYFPSGRRCPQLFDHLAELQQALAAHRATPTATTAETLTAAIAHFLTTGLTAAGYAPTDIARLRPFITIDRLPAFAGAVRLGGNRHQLFPHHPPTPAQLAWLAASNRLLRAIAILHHLDPDTALPEDLLLLRRTPSGHLHAHEEYTQCTRWLATSRPPRA